MTDAEEKTMMTMWCVLKSPLLLGNDLSKLTDRIMSIVGNEALISVNQDALGLPALRVAMGAGNATQVYVGPLSGGSKIVVLLNLGSTNTTITADWATLGLNPNQKILATDLWNTEAPSKPLTSEVTAMVESHAAKVLKFFMN